MLERTLSRKIVDKLCEQDVIVPSDVAAYVYGYELLISSVISLSLIHIYRRRNAQKQGEMVLCQLAPYKVADTCTAEGTQHFHLSLIHI